MVINCLHIQFNPSLETLPQKSWVTTPKRVSDIHNKICRNSLLTSTRHWWGETNGPLIFPISQVGVLVVVSISMWTVQGECVCVCWRHLKKLFAKCTGCCMLRNTRWPGSRRRKRPTRVMCGSTYVYESLDRWLASIQYILDYEIEWCRLVKLQVIMQMHNGT